MEELFDAIRSACSANSWSRGVELVRGDAVIGERAGDDEIRLRVETRGGMVSPSVTFYPDDDEWECTCSSREAACEHVAAAIIALRKARKRGEALPSPAQQSGRIRYAFTREGGGLSLQREIVTGNDVHPLRTTLHAVASGRVEGPRFAATAADVAVESALGTRLRGPMPRETLLRIAEPLSRCEDVQLDGKPIRVSGERLTLLGRIEDAPEGFRVSVAPNPSITENFDGVALCGDVLKLFGETRLTGRELEQLPRGRFIPFDQIVNFVTEDLPSLRERIPFEIETDKLPTTTESEPPRIELEVKRDGDGLSVLATLVYGDPPAARIDAGRLVHLSGSIPIRDEAAERARVRHLKAELGLSPGHRATFSGEDALAMAQRLDGWRGEIRGDSHRGFHRTAPLEPRLSVDGDAGFALRFETAADTEATPGRPVRQASAESVLAAWRSGESLVPVSGGGFAPLPADWLARFGDRVADLLAARDADGAIQACALPDLARLCEDLDEPPPLGIERLRPLIEGFEGIPTHAPPEGVRAELRAYQQHGLDWLRFLRDAGLGALLADDMGLGKTLQALCVLQGRSLVVAPTSVLHSWADEIERFRPDLRVCVYHGARRTLDPEADVTLTSYAILRLDIKVLSGIEWDCSVLDEAQAIKNPTSQVAAAAFKLRARFRVALTGTPVENRLEELWSQIHYLNPGLLGGRRDFQERYARRISDEAALATETGVPARSSETAARLRERIRPFVLRRLKRDVAPELPPRSEVVLHCELSDTEREVYDAVRAATVADAVARIRAGGGVMAALEALLRLRQAACHPGLVPGQEATQSTKVSLLVDRLEQAVEDGHKALVFSQWTSLLDRVEPPLREAGIDFERLDGSTRDRAGVVGRFQADSGAPILLVSLRAGGTGLNLTAADHVFLLDPWWNPAVEDQAADRAHRIGQTRSVVVHRLVSRDTVEERILELQLQKRGIAEAALGEGEIAAALSRDDLLRLFD